jgi:hypothetical protein
MGTGRSFLIMALRPPVRGLFFLWRLWGRVLELPARTRACPFDALASPKDRALFGASLLLLRTWAIVVSFDHPRRFGRTSRMSTLLRPRPTAEPLFT